MKLFSTTVAFLACFSVVHSHPAPRDASSIVSAMDDISTQITGLRDSLKKFDPGIIGTITALQIHTQALHLAGVIADAKYKARLSQPLDEAESAEVANGVTGLQPHVFGVLDEMIAKKDAFDKAILGVGSARILVKADLKLLRQNTAEFGEKVTEKLNPEFATLAPLLLANIDAHFREAIIVYS